MKKPIVLCILDGCGIREEKDGNAFLNANTPTLDKLFKEYPSSLLLASGKSVGLPDNMTGTSEVGHMNLGAGRVVMQALEIINNAILSKEIYNNKNLLEVLNHVKNNNSTLHISGLLSDGCVHSDMNHLFVILDICKKHNIKNIYLHLFTDGRDTYEKSAVKYFDILNEYIKDTNIKIATISGRYYAMDRDNNFDRVKLFYDALVYGNALKYDSYSKLINDNYEKGITDEFIYPGIINEKTLEDNDAYITFNFRKDRLREVFTLLSNEVEYKNLALEKNLKIKHFNNLKTLTMFPVTNTVKSDHMFNDTNLSNLLGEYLYNNNISQLRIAETEKYAHVTYYFDGGREVDYPNMKKILINSPKVATYDLKPEMSIYEVTNTFLDEINNYDVTIMNIANGDMVGHTGKYESTIKAVEHIDKCIDKIYTKIKELGGILILVADHGNCDMMWDINKLPVTSHTKSPVPFIITDSSIKLKNGKLADVAPTMLKLMGLSIPKEMTGDILIEE